MKTRFLPVWLLAVALIGAGFWQSAHDAAHAAVTTYYVTNNNDSGPGSLRAAVDSANDGDEVHVVTPGPILLNNTIAITKSITIEGPEIAVNPTASHSSLPNSGDPSSTGQVDIVGANGSVFTIASGKSVTMTHLYITNGAGTNGTLIQPNSFGGGIYNQGTLVLDHCTVAGNNATAVVSGGNVGGNAYGGGIYSTGTLTLDYSTVSGNTATGANGPNAGGTENGAFGGGIYATGPTTITHSTISGNTATGGDSATNDGGSAYGGGIAQASPGTINLTNSTVYNNSAQGGNGAANDGSAYGGGVAVSNTTFTPLLNVTIMNNTVAAGATTAGAGVYYENATDQLTGYNAIIASNTGSANDVDSTPLPSNLSHSLFGALTGTFGNTLGGPTNVVSGIPSAVNGGVDPGAPALPTDDQRGATPRVFGGTVDIGAVESGAAVPTSSFAPVVPNPFYLQMLNGSVHVKATDFQNAVTPSGNLKSIIITSIPPATQGYWELNGQVLTQGSVISVDDLDNLTYVSVDGTTQPTLTWQASDGTTTTSTITTAMPNWYNDLVALDLNPAPGNQHVYVTQTSNPSGAGTTPTLTVSQSLSGQLIGVSDYTGSFSFSFTAISGSGVPPSGTASRVDVSVSGASSPSPSFDTGNTTTDPAALSQTLTITKSPGMHFVSITATDINGGSRTYAFSFFVDAYPDFNPPGAAITTTQFVDYGEPYTHEFDTHDPDASIPSLPLTPDSANYPEPLHLQIDQNCYTPDQNGACTGNSGDSNIAAPDTIAWYYNVDGTYRNEELNWVPPKPGKYGVTVTIADYWGLSHLFGYYIIVNKPSTPTWTDPSQTAQLNDSSFSLDLNDYVSGLYAGNPATSTPAATPTFNFVSGTLPPGTSFSPTGVISGTPTTAGPYTVTVNVDDGLGNIIPKTFTITVVNGAPIYDAPTPDEGDTVNFAVGSSISIPVAAHDLNGDTVNWSLSSLTLPGAGAVTISPATGNSATITSANPLTSADVGNHAVTLTASDGTNNAVRHFTIKVTNGNAPVITTTVQNTYNITAGSNFSLPFNATDADGSDTLTFSVTGGGGMTAGASSAGPPTTQAATYDFNAVPAGSYTITVTVKDANNNVSNPVTFKINAGTGTPPSISLTPAGPSFSATTGVSIPTIKATATDGDAGETLTFSLSGAQVPAGMTLSSPASFSGVASGDPKSVTLQWTPTTTQAGSYTFDIVVTDSQGFQASVPVTINVTASTEDHAPNVVNPVSATGYVGIPFNLPIVASDPDGDAITFSAANLPPGLTINSNTGVISGTPTTVGTYNTVEVTVTDNSTLTNGPLSTTTPQFTIIIGQVNLPKISNKAGIVSGSPYTVAPSASFIKQFAATDDDYPETLTFTASYSDDNGVTNTPLNGSTYWSQFNQVGPTNGDGTGTSASSTFTWNNIPAGVHVVTVVVTDGSGYSDQVTFTVQAGNAPTLTVAPTGAINVVLGDSMPNITAKAKDADNNENLSFTLDNAPVGMTFNGPSSFGPLPSNTETSPVTIQWTPTAAQAGSYSFDVVVTDKDGLQTSQPVTVNVLTPGVPSFTSPLPGTTVLHVGDVFDHTFTATDSDTGDTLTFNAEIFKYDTGTSTWVSQGVNTLLDQGYNGGPPTSASAELTWTASALGNYRVDVTVNDSQGHQAIQTLFINVVNGAPVIEPIANQSISIGDDFHLQIQATDPDSDTLYYSLVQAPAWLNINTSTGEIFKNPAVTITASDIGSQTVIVSVDDGVNPAVTTSFTVTVSDEGVPLLSSVAGPITLHVNEAYTNVFTATDSDASDTLTFTVAPDGSGNVTSGFTQQSYSAGPPTTATSELTWSASAVGNYQVDVKVTDSQSHTATTTFFINVIPDVPAPTISNPGTWFASVGGFSTTSVPPADSSEDTTNWHWTSSDLPTWVTLDEDTGILSGTPGPGDVGTTTVTVSVNDGVNPPVSVTFDINVSNRGVPTLAATPTALASPEECLNGSGYTRMFVSQDTDYPENLVFKVKVTDVGGNVLIDDVSTDPNSAIRRIYQSGSLDQGGTTAGAEFDWTPSVSGIYQVDISVTDQQGHVTSLSYSIRVSSPPTIQVNNTTAPVTINATPELPITPIPVQVSDPDNHETLVVTLDFNAPFGMTVKSPSTFSNVTGGTPQNTELDFTPTISQANQSFTFNVTVTDSAGLTATQQVTVNVGAVNARPVISSPTANSTVNVVTGHTVSIPVVATDAEGDTLTYGATGLPAGLSIDSSTGVINGTVTAVSGTNTVTVTVDDGYHISPAASVTFKIVVGSTNHAPTLSAIGDQTLIIGQSLNVQAVGSDPDHDALTYSITGNPAWVSIDPATGLITIPDTAQESEGSWDITVTVDDGYGGTASQSFVLTVNGPFSVSTSSGDGYISIIYTVTNTTGSTISPIVRGNLSGSGYTRNEDASFSPSQGFVDSQWASPKLQRDLDPAKNTRILTWTVGSLAPGASATLTISVPVRGSIPNGTELTSLWTMDYGATELTVSPVLSN